jgi:hypothetical protein
VPRLPAALAARSARRRRVRLPDRNAFRFADGLEPFVDVATYRPGPADAAMAAALERLARRGGATGGDYHRPGL